VNWGINDILLPDPLTSQGELLAPSAAPAQRNAL